MANNSDKIDEDCLDLFEQNIGKKFRLKGVSLVDEIVGVDRELKTVNGKVYGNFGVHLCELTNEDLTVSGN